MKKGAKMVTELKKAGFVRVLELIISILLLVVGANLSFSVNRVVAQLDRLDNTSGKHDISITDLKGKYEWHERRINSHDIKINALEKCSIKTNNDVIKLESILGK